jgi:hypothetical protein
MEGCGAVAVAGADSEVVCTGEGTGVVCGDMAAVWDGVGVGLGSKAEAAPVRPGPVSNETASKPVPKDIMIGRRD